MMRNPFEMGETYALSGRPHKCVALTEWTRGLLANMQVATLENAEGKLFKATRWPSNEVLRITPA